MRARELFEERKADVPDGARDVMQPTMVVHDLDGNYELYRLLIAVAGLPATKGLPLASVTPDKPYFAPYSKQEHETLTDMLKSMGKHPEHLTKKHSEEPKGTNKASPVRPFKDYQ
jgi:hypothetical protein